MILIKNGIVFKDGQWLEDVDLIVDDGKIVDIVKGDEKVEAEIVDANGGYVCPGFINLHIHGAEGHDVMDG